MSGVEFEQFAEAMAGRAGSEKPAGAVRYDNITVLGGAGDGLLIAALCLAQGADVTLFSAYGAQLDGLRQTGTISLRGAGPAGNYHVDQPGSPCVQTTGELDRAVADAEVIFLTGPVHKQRTYAMVLADHVRDGQVLVLAPGRSLGAAEAAWLLRMGGAKADFTIVEAQGLPYWFARSGTTLTLSGVCAVAAGTLPAGQPQIIAGLQRFLPNLEPVPSTIHSSFADGSGLVEVPGLLLGGPAMGDGAPAIPHGGVPLAENNTFRALIGPRHEAVMVQMAKERHKVARIFGVRDLPDLGQWLDIHAGTAKGDGARPVPGRDEAAHIVRCATTGSLASLVSAAGVAGHDVPVTSAMIALSSSVLGADVVNAGRKLETIGINAGDAEDARRLLDDIARGAR